MMDVPRLPNERFWHGKRVLLTGHTGFKGAWLARWLAELGAQTTGLALAPDGEPNLFEAAQIGQDCRHEICDLTDASQVNSIVSDCRPDIVLHLAAQSIVRKSYDAPVDTVATNVLGTTLLLNAIRQVQGVDCVLVVTSDKVYANEETGRAFVESDTLGGHDPYSASKAACEIITKSMATSFLEPSGTRVGAARGGNVIGGGDFSHDRIVPDIWRSTLSEAPLVLRNPHAVRPWQHVLDCLAGYLVYVEVLSADTKTPRALNIGPSAGKHLEVGEIATIMLREFESTDHWLTAGSEQPREMGSLSIDPSLARRTLGVKDQWGGRMGFLKAAEWYRRFGDGEDARLLMTDEITTYHCWSDQ